ncbi:MAG: hypothetical protein HKM05_11855 [Spirochaetales bacterium]|nr:hypothetical protein [Spirochaetales bacterium]
MKRLFWVFALVLASATPALAYKILYAEQWYQLFHEHLYQYPDDCMENIWYLEQARKADFANPLNALTKITNKTQWALYRDLFMMHVDILLIQQYLQLGHDFDKDHAYFFNYPWKAANLDSLKTAEKVYKVAFGYWDDAVRWAEKAKKYPFIELDNIQFWSDQAWRIQTGDLNYRSIIQRQIDHLKKVRQEFEAMGPKTY